MDTKALRQKILDLAIRGKLVPQDPNDEPASVLLERIRQQKQQMVKEGKLKAKDVKNDSIIFVGEDNLHYEKFADGTVKCIEDEIPFEIPASWTWARLGSVSTIARGGSPRPIESYLTNDSNGLNWIKIGDAEKDGKYITSTKEKIRPEGLQKTRYVQAGDFLLTNSMSFGRPYILRTNGCIHDGWLVIGNTRYVFCQDYLYYALSSSHMYETLNSLAVGSTVKNLKSDSVKSLLFPIPPLPEQEQIAKYLDKLSNIISSVNEQQLYILGCIQLAKSRILDLAIRGKLVPQDPNDEPASILLERIRAEKEELIRQGKIKRDKKESVIFKGDDNSYYEKIGNEIRCIDEEIPFDIPDSWMWVRLENCCAKEIRRGKSPTYAAESNVLVFAQKCNTKCNGIDLLLSLHLDVGTLSRYPQDEYMLDEDIVINSTGTGTLGRVGIYRNIDNPLGIPIVPDSHVTVIRSHKVINSFYLYTYLKASQKKLEESGEGSTNQKELKPATLKELLVSLPPYAEQTRIVDSIQATLLPIETIERSLN